MCEASSRPLGHITCYEVCKGTILALWFVCAMDGTVALDRRFLLEIASCIHSDVLVVGFPLLSKAKQANVFSKFEKSE